MNHLTFFKDIKTSIHLSYVFMGQEEYVKERALDELRTKVLDGGNEDFNLQVLGEDTELNEVYESVATLPFMGDRRLVIWNNPRMFLKEINDEDLELLKEIIETLHDSVCLVIVIKGLPDKRRKYFKILKDKCTLVEFNPLTEFDAAVWVCTYFKRKTKQIEPSMAEKIVEMVGTSVLDLNNEVEKINAAMGERVLVEDSDLKVLTGGNINFGVFEMINSFLCGNSKKGMEEMYRLIESGQSGFMILGTLAAKLRSYYQAQVLLQSGMERSAVIEALGGGYGAKMAVKECNRFSSDGLKRGIDALEYADFAIKNGLLNEKSAVEYAITKIFMVK